MDQARVESGAHVRHRRLFAGATLAVLATGIAGAAAWQPGDGAIQPAEAGVSAPGDEPGDAHLGLARLAGEWHTESIFVTGGEMVGQPEHGSATIEAIMGGRFIAIQERGGPLGEGGESMKMFGFNNAAGLYEATWVYTGSTAMMRARGISDPSTGVLTFQAQYASGAETTEKFVITLAPDDGDEPQSLRITLVALMEDGSAGPTLETLYTRISPHEHEHTHEHGAHGDGGGGSSSGAH